MQPESSVQLDKSVSDVRRLASTLGCDVLDPNFRMSKRSIRVLLILGIAYLSIVYSVWRNRDNALMTMKICVIVTKGVQLMPKFWNAVVRRQKTLILLGDLRTMLGELQGNQSNEPILLKHMIRLNFWQKTLLTSYITAMVILITAILMVSVINGEFTLMFEIYIPFVDETTLLGYALVTISHVVYLAVGVAVYPAFDSFFMILSLPIGAFVDALDNEMRELNQILVGEDSSSQKRVNEKLRRIYRLHQMLVDFESMVDDHYSGHNWILLSCNMIGMVCCIFLGYVKGYYTGYGVLITLLAQISEYCILGAYVAAKNQRMVEIVYTINFYKLSTSHQRMVSLMLHRAQHATELSAGGIVPLNMETYVETLKGMYTYITILTTMMD